MKAQPQHKQLQLQYNLFLPLWLKCSLKLQLSSIAAAWILDISFTPYYVLPRHIASQTAIMSKTFSTDEVASHNKPTDLYIIVDEDVYDLTKFQDEHPGLPPLVPPPFLHQHS